MAHPPNDDSRCPQPNQHYNPTTFGYESDFVDVQKASGETAHQGVTVFVYVNCVTNAPLDCGKGTIQDPIWCMPDVALSRSVAQAYLAALPSASATGSGTVLESVPNPTPTIKASNIALVTYLHIAHPEPSTTCARYIHPRLVRHQRHPVSEE